MKIEPFGERLAIKVIQPEEKTEGGLIVATSKNSSNRGEIVAIGEEVKDYFSLILFSKTLWVFYHKQQLDITSVHRYNQSQRR